MIRFAVNTTYEAAGTVALRVLEKKLENAGHRVARNVADLENYDVVIYMAPDSKVRETKKKYPNLLVGIFDPKATLSWQRAETRTADFVVVSSLEQREFFLQFNKNICIYYMFPDVPEMKKSHSEKKEVIIGYHGNKQHLDAMQDVSWALDEVVKKYPIKLRAIYNIKKLGEWAQNAPQVCPVEHVQWVENDFLQSLSECDIGIMPSLLPVPKWKHIVARPFRSLFLNREGYNEFDYLNRYKPSNNPGRLHIFSQLHIPVVSDFTPSTCQIITDGISGILAGTREGWMRGIEMLVQNTKLRASLGDALHDRMQSAFSIEKSAQDFMVFIQHLYGSRQ